MPLTYERDAKVPSNVGNQYPSVESVPVTGMPVKDSTAFPVDQYSSYPITASTMHSGPSQFDSDASTRSLAGSTYPLNSSSGTTSSSMGSTYPIGGSSIATGSGTGIPQSSYPNTSVQDTSYPSSGLHDSSYQSSAPMTASNTSGTAFPVTSGTQSYGLAEGSTYGSGPVTGSTLIHDEHIRDRTIPGQGVDYNTMKAQEKADKHRDNAFVAAPAAGQETTVGGRIEGLANDASGRYDGFVTSPDGINSRVPKEHTTGRHHDGTHANANANNNATIDDRNITNNNNNADVNDAEGTHKKGKIGQFISNLTHHKNKDGAVDNTNDRSIKDKEPVEVYQESVNHKEPIDVYQDSLNRSGSNPATTNNL